LFKKAFSKLSPVLLLVLLLAPVSRSYAQSVSAALKPDAITGGDPEPTGEPDAITGGDPEPAGEPDAITGGDPEPTGEPDGAAMLQEAPLGTVLTVSLS
jgi:hypothetical protein